MRDVTLVYLLKGDDVYLARKAKDKFGGDLFNGYGGKVKAGETILDCAVRETFEESGVILNTADLEKMAVIEFYFPDVDESKGWNQKAHVYFARKWNGTPVETEEMLEPRLFNKNNLPVNMWVADREWLKVALTGQKFTTEIYFEGKGTGFKPFNLNYVNSFS